MKEIYMQYTLNFIFHEKGEDTVSSIVNSGNIKTISETNVNYLIIEHDDDEIQ